MLVLPNQKHTKRTKTMAENNAFVSCSSECSSVSGTKQKKITGCDATPLYENALVKHSKKKECNQSNKTDFSEVTNLNLDNDNSEINKTDGTSPSNINTDFHNNTLYSQLYSLINDFKNNTTPSSVSHICVPYDTIKHLLKTSHVNRFYSGKVCSALTNESINLTLENVAETIFKENFKEYSPFVCKSDPAYIQKNYTEYTHRNSIRIHSRKQSLKLFRKYQQKQCKFTYSGIEMNAAACFNFSNMSCKIEEFNHSLPNVIMTTEECLCKLNTRQEKNKSKANVLGKDHKIDKFSERMRYTNTRHTAKKKDKKTNFHLKLNCICHNKYKHIAAKNVSHGYKNNHLPNSFRPVLQMPVSRRFCTSLVKSNPFPSNCSHINSQRLLKYNVQCGPFSTVKKPMLARNNTLDKYQPRPIFIIQFVCAIVLIVFYTFLYLFVSRHQVRHDANCFMLRKLLYCMPKQFCLHEFPSFSISASN